MTSLIVNLAVWSRSCPLNQRTTTPVWYAYPPDGVLEVSAMSGLRMWKFITQATLSKTPQSRF